MKTSQARMNRFVLLQAALLIFFAALPAFAQTIRFTNLPFEMPELKTPVFPDRTFSVADHGGAADGQTNNTQAFAGAIDACAKAGGGRVLVPAGIWLTGPIELKSRVNLHLEAGALILFSTDIEAYPLRRANFEGTDSIRRMSPITAANVEDIAVTGPGIIDGSGQAWRPVKKDKLTEKQWKTLVASGGALESGGKIWWPSEKALNGSKTVSELNKRNADIAEYAAAGEFLRPVMVSLVNCKNILLEETTFQNSPGWNIHPLLCENLVIRNISVRNPWFSQNGDGLDLDSSRNALVENCRFDVGDDAICMKSGKDEQGRRRGKPTENVVIRNCTVYHGHGGFTIGSEMSGGIRNILVSNCTFLGTDVGLRFKSTRGRGGIVENIFIDGIRMTDIPTDAISFNLFYAGDAPDLLEIIDLPAEPVSEETPIFRKIFMKNITCRGAANGLHMQGLPEMPVGQIVMENMTLAADKGITCAEAEGITFKNVRVTPKKGPAFILCNARKIALDQVQTDAGAVLELSGPKTAAVMVTGSGPAPDNTKIHFTNGAKPEALSWK